VVDYSNNLPSNPMTCLGKGQEGLRGREGRGGKREGEEMEGWQDRRLVGELHHWCWGIDGPGTA